MSRFNCSHINVKHYTIIMVVCSLLLGCIDPFEPTTPFFERVLVIDATLTDEVKNQEFTLSSTFEFEEFVPLPEERATIKVVDDSQIEYTFQEESPGKYISTSVFGAQPGVSYQLFITTADGRNYVSDPALAPPSVPIYDLKATRTLNDQAEDGISIDVKYAPSSETKYFRYEYEEMYKIIAPRWTDVTLRWVSEFEAIVWPKSSRGGRVCYKTVDSNTIIFNSPKGNDIGESLEYPIRFINSYDYILSHRYGIRVKQFAITREAHTYLETLKKFAGQDNIFSQTQPGFFNGNIFSETDSNEKVLGYFDVTSVTIESVFFDYEDFFPDEPMPDYVDACNVTFPDPAAIRDLMSDGRFLYYSTSSPGSHSVVKRVCGDCTVLGESEIPEFWVE